MSRTAILVIVVVVLLGLGIGFGTGLYVVPRYEVSASCCVGQSAVARAETLWFLRPGLAAPFISSDGGMLIRYKKEGLSLFERIGRVVEYRDRVQRRAILRLPYLPLLYRLSAEGRSPVKYDEAF